MPAIELSSDEFQLLRETLGIYLADLRRQVAATENPEFRRDLQHRQDVLEQVLSNMDRRAAA
jgi:hypothetical protein